MTKQEVDHILNWIAREHNISPDAVRREILHAMKKAQASTDPKAQALWASVPKKGEEITTEEFLTYILQYISTPLS